MGRIARLAALVLAGVPLVIFLGCGAVNPVPVRPKTHKPVLLAAGDITGCDDEADAQTARLIDAHAGTVATLGDNAYSDGTIEEFVDCYAPTWGAAKKATRPAPGNHEYGTLGAAGYFDYFGSAAGQRGRGWYSYRLGSWHIVVLNSNCEEVGGCEPDSPQGRWLKANLRRHRGVCTLAYFHHSRFSSGGRHGNAPEVSGFWRVLYRHRADVVLSAHDHDYERFKRLDPSGRPDSVRGIREFVVGTGGADLRPFGTIKEGSVVRDASAHGVLKLTLRRGSYGWRFLPVAGDSFTDAGTGRCH